MTGRELLELIANQLSRLTNDVHEIKVTMATKEELTAVEDKLKEELTTVKATMATKEELTTVKDELKNELTAVKDTMATKEELAEIKDTMATKEELAEIREELRSIKNIVIKIENDHGQKLNALFDGYKLHSEKLERIEAEVTKHEEFIIKRLK